MTVKTTQYWVLGIFNDEKIEVVLDNLWTFSSRNSHFKRHPRLGMRMKFSGKVKCV